MLTRTAPLILALLYAACDGCDVAVGVGTDEPATAITTEKGRITVPGRAVADGRDLQADPPVTVGQINVWNNVSRTQRVCRVAHGTELALLEARRKESEGRFYFRIRSGECEGWLPESFVRPPEQPGGG